MAEYSDIMWNVLLLIGSLSCLGLVVAAFGEDIGASFAAIILAIVALVFVANNYLGDQIVDGSVLQVSKVSMDGKVTVKLSATPGMDVELPNQILKAYEVAVVATTGSKTPIILKNLNSLWRLKFNKRAIQLQLEPDKKYKFHVYRLFFAKNILTVQEE